MDLLFVAQSEERDSQGVGGAALGLGTPPSRLLPPGTLGWHRPGSETPSGVAHSGDPRTPWAAAPPLR